MKNILVPTDFSENSRCAFEYALKMADQLDANVTVVHIYHPSVNHMNEYMIITDNELDVISRERLQSFVGKSFEKTIEGVVVAEMVEQRLEIGFAADQLVEMSKSGDYDMIVMGATGSTGLLEQVFGKVSLHVAKTAACPVLLIPAGVNFEPINEIMYAIEYESVSEKALAQLEVCSKKFDAKIHLVHVYDENEKKKDGLKSSLLEKAFQMKAPNLKFTMEAINSDSVAHGLDEYAMTNDMDWMVLVKPQRKLWQRLLHTSKTNEIIMNPQIPLMVMH